MKGALCVMLCIFLSTLHAQINLEQSYSSTNLGLIKLSVSGYKYFEKDSNDIILYNLNHTVFRTITIPALPTTSGNIVVNYISEDLFDTNPTDIEYLVTYIDTIGPLPLGQRHVAVFDENGNTLFTRDTAELAGSSVPLAGVSGTISATTSGVKMILLHYPTQTTEVYSLPGVLTCMECNGGIISGIQPEPVQENGEQQQLIPYPNPSNTSTTIPYELPEGVHSGQIAIYNMLGEEVIRYHVTDTFSSIVIDRGELPSGMYTYMLVTGSDAIPGNKFVISE